MANEIKLPQMGRTMEEGTIINCLVKVGQKVKKGDHLFEVETDKAAFEMESPAEGFVKAIIAEHGQTLPVGKTLLILGEENEKINVPFNQNKKTKKAAVPTQKTSADCGEPGRTEQITQADINSIAQNQINYKLGQKVPLSRLAKKQAEKMLLSKREIPCFYLNIIVDATELAGFSEKLSAGGCLTANDTADIKISFDDFLMKALALGLKQWPIMTGRLEGDSIVLADSIGIGLAVAVKEGTVFAVVKDVDKKNLTQIAKHRTDLVKRAESGSLTPDDIEGGCITISNLGKLGIDSFIPIVLPGQCSILGAGQIADTCVSQDGKMSIRKLAKMTLAVDHKVANGAEAAQFLSCVGKLLEDPKKLI
jgi:pyruvate dehydrogenase E2 component (dihydrolipoamide acetyltransferase)